MTKGLSSFVSDVISINKTGEHFRLLYDVKGRFTVHRISPEEAKVTAVVLACCSALALRCEDDRNNPSSL